MLLERVLFPVTDEVVIYPLIGHDEYGQPRYAEAAGAPCRGFVRRTTRTEQRGDKAIALASVELVLGGVRYDGPELVGARVVVGGESQEYVVRGVRREGGSFAPALVCELEGLGQ